MPTLIVLRYTHLSNTRDKKFLPLFQSGHKITIRTISSQIILKIKQLFFSLFNIKQVVNKKKKKNYKTYALPDVY